MARLGVTKDDVFSACKNLLKSGITITVANVREELGTGSYTTLLPLIDAFKITTKEAADKAHDGSSGNENLPSELQAQGSKFIQDLWWQATSEAKKKIEELSLKFQKDLSVVKSDLTAKSLELSQSLNDIKKLEQTQENIIAESAKKDRELQQKEGEIKLLKTQLKEKDQELKAFLERAITAEKKLEFMKDEKKK